MNKKQARGLWSRVTQGERDATLRGSMSPFSIDDRMSYEVSIEGAVSVASIVGWLDEVGLDPRVVRIRGVVIE